MNPPKAITDVPGQPGAVATAEGLGLGALSAHRPATGGPQGGAGHHLAGRADEADLPPWEECDVFCVTGYAAPGGGCGWRGRARAARWDPDRRLRACPWCGHHNLFGLHDPGPPAGK